MNGTEWLQSQSAPGLKPAVQAAMAPERPRSRQPAVKPVTDSRQAARAPSARNAATKALEARLQAALQVTEVATANLGQLKAEYVASLAADLTPEEATQARQMASSHAHAIGQLWKEHYANITRLDREYAGTLSRLGC